jgi:hypothetical protein
MSHGMARNRMIGVGIFIAMATTEKIRCGFEIAGLAGPCPIASARRVPHRGRRAAAALSFVLGAPWQSALASSLQR